MGNLTTRFFLEDFTAEGALGAEEEKREMNNLDINGFDLSHEKAIIVETQAIYMLRNI